MTDSELGDAYTALCKTMTELGEPNTRLFLARFALLAMTQIGDASTTLRLIDSAAEDLRPPAR